MNEKIAWENYINKYLNLFIYKKDLVKKIIFGSIIKNIFYVASFLQILDYFQT